MIERAHDRRMPKEHVGHRCGHTGKRRFKSAAHAIARAAEIMESGTEAKSLRTYLCDFCGGYHLTSK